MNTFKKHHKKLYKVLSFFIYIIIPIVLFILVTSRTSMLLGIRSFTVMTGSMEPIVHVGSMVFTKPENSYQIGDIITFKRGDITITHRITGIKNGQFETKGDANKSDDPQYVSQGNIIGKNIFSIPFFGRFTSFLKTIPGFILLIGLPILIFVLFEAKNIKEEWEKEIEKKVMKKIHTLEEKI